MPSGILVWLVVPVLRAALGLGVLQLERGSVKCLYVADLENGLSNLKDGRVRHEGPVLTEGDSLEHFVHIHRQLHVLQRARLLDIPRGIEGIFFPRAAPGKVGVEGKSRADGGVSPRAIPLLEQIRRTRMGCIEVTLDKRQRIGQLILATRYGRRSSRRRHRWPSDTGTAPRGDSLGGRGRGYGRRIHLVSTHRSHRDAARPQVFEHDQQEFGDGLRATGGILIAAAEAVPRLSAEELLRTVAAILFRPQIEEETILREGTLHLLSAVVAQVHEQPPLPRSLRQIQPCHMMMTEMRAASSLPENR